MPTLLEKPTQIAAAPLMPADVLRLRYRWERWRGVLLMLLAGLAVTLTALWTIHLRMHTPRAWEVVAGIWVAGLFLTILAAAAGWHFAPSSLLDTAQHMDRDLTTKNRLEATATLHESNSPLARAQREETALFLSREPRGIRPPRALPWLVGGILLLAAAHLVTLGLWVIPFGAHAPAPVPPPPPAKEMPKASIVWKSPEPESKANPIEEVPAVAVAQSTTGLKDLSLEISVNGTPKKTVPLPATPYDKAGKNILKVSLYMDELGVEPFDVVAYFIRAQRITDQKVPDTTSAIQFIQVRPFRDDVTQVHGAHGNKNYELLIRLKLAQLRSVKENFVLAHTDLAVTNPLRMKENDRVGKNQGELSAKTEEVVQAFIAAGYPADMIDLLQQAEPPMDDASKKILATQNAQALPPQQKALSLIVEVEKFFHKIMADGGSSPPDDNPSDPFKDKQQHELKKRMEAAAGQLEILAKNQMQLSDDLSHPGSSDAGTPSPAGAPDSSANPAPGASDASADGSQKVIPLPPAQSVDPFGPDSGKGTPAERQTRVVQGIETLLNGNTVLPDTVTQALQEAQKDATSSMHDLNQADEAGAREPAAHAAEDLQKAIAEMNKAGDEQTKQAMEEGQQKLNDLAHQLSDLAQKGGPDAQQKLAGLAQQAADIQKQLEDAADKQQEAGSAAGAQRLEHLAKALADQKIAQDLSGMAKTGLDANKAATDVAKLEALAGQAAAAAIPGKPSAQDLANLINSLERSRANLARLAQQAGGSLPDAATPMGTAPGQNPGQPKPGDQGKQGAGKTPGQDQAGQTPGKGQQSGQGQGPQPGAQKGQGEGAQSDASSKGQGQGQSQGQGQGQPQSQGQGQGQGTPSPDNPPTGSSGGSEGNSASGSGGQNDPKNPNAAAPGGIGTDSNSNKAPSGYSEAYHEVIADLKDEAQLANATVQNANTTALMNAVIRYDQDTRYRDVTSVNVVHGYQAIAGPLDQLLFELKADVAHAQRDEVVKQPDLDDAPPAYRSAVSDYFESMSKDYHPDSDTPNTNKP